MLKLQRVTAYCKRFINNDRVPINQRSHGPLTNDELINSFLTIVSKSQETTFNQDIKKLLGGQSLSTKSKFISLNPFVDGNGVLCVGGRLVQSSYGYDKKNIPLF